MIVSVVDRPVRPAHARTKGSPWPSYAPPAATAIVALRPTGCRWPVGEVTDETFAFCGAPRMRGSYCLRHRRLAYVQPATAGRVVEAAR